MVEGTDKEIIFLEVHKIENLVFKSSIPLSCKRLLNEDVEEFIVEEAEKLKVNPITLLIKVTEPSNLREGEVAEMIHTHFAHCKDKAEKQQQDILRLGWKSLLVAFVFVIAMVFLTRILAKLMSEGDVMLMLKELLIILGWVALWRPADLLLYEWRPFKRKARLYGKLSECNVQLQQS